MKSIFYGAVLAATALVGVSAEAAVYRSFVALDAENRLLDGKLVGSVSAGPNSGTLSIPAQQINYANGDGSKVLFLASNTAFTYAATAGAANPTSISNCAFPKVGNYPGGLTSGGGYMAAGIGKSIICTVKFGNGAAAPVDTVTLTFDAD